MSMVVGAPSGLYQQTGDWCAWDVEASTSTQHVITWQLSMSTVVLLVSLQLHYTTGSEDERSTKERQCQHWSDWCSLADCVCVCVCVYAGDWWLVTLALSHVVMMVFIPCFVQLLEKQSGWYRDRFWGVIRLEYYMAVTCLMTHHVWAWTTSQIPRASCEPGGLDEATGTSVSCGRAGHETPPHFSLPKAVDQSHMSPTVDIWHMIQSQECMSETTAVIVWWCAGLQCKESRDVGESFAPDVVWFLSWSVVEEVVI